MRDRPIGYWLKELDGRLERDFERGLAEEGLLRRHWQLLNGLRQAPLTRAEIDTWPFKEIDEALDELVARGWVGRDGPAWKLTTEGEEAQARVAERVAQLRLKVLTDVTEEEYVATVRVLQRVVDNIKE